MFELLGIIVLFLLTMVSYSAGLTLVARRRPYEPRVLDLILVFSGWLLVMWLRSEVDGHLLMLAVALVLGLGAGIIMGTIRFAGHDAAGIMPDSELPEHAREKPETAVATNVFKRAWQRWNDFAGRMGGVQGRLLMGFFYFIIVTPFGVVARLFTDALAIKKAPDQSNWRPKEGTDLTIEAAQEQG